MCCGDKDLFKPGTGRRDRRSPGMDVEIDVPALLTGDRSQAFLFFFRQSEVVVKATDSAAVKERLYGLFGPPQGQLGSVCF